MTKTDALRIAAQFDVIGGFTEVRVSHFGFIATDAQGDASSAWEVELWSTNARAGNRTLTTIRSASEVPDAKTLARVARAAKGKATAADKAALARASAQKSLDAE